MLATVALSLAALALLAAGWWLPEVLLYLVGVAVAAVLVGIVLLRRHRKVLSAVAVIAVLAGGLGLPLVAGRGDAGGPAWHTSLSGQTVVRAGGVFIAADDGRVHLVTLTGGRELWSVPGWSPVVGSDGDLVTFGSSDRRVARYDTHGRQLWSLPATSLIHGHLRSVAMASGTTVLSSCASDDTGTTSTCFLAGVGVGGRILWQRVFRDAAVPVPHDLLPTVSGQAPSSVAVRVRRGRTSMLLVVDPTSGRPLVAERMPPAYVTGLLMMVGTRVVAARPGCGLEDFDEGTLIGRTRNPAECHGPMLPTGVVSVPGDRFYVRTVLGGPVATFDIDLGEGRVLDPDEYAGTDSPTAFGPSVVLAEPVSGGSRELVATDAASGKVVWHRALDADTKSADDARWMTGVWNGDTVVVRELSHVRNPYLRPHLQLGDGRFGLFADRSRRFGVLDTDTGRELAAVLDGSARGADVRVVAGDGYAVVSTPEGTYRVG
ncbi:hypothetical protein GCM10027076_08140 [Nocardioides montaniterrae]